MLSKKSGNEAANTRINSILGQNTVFEGNIRSKETIRIDGLVQGDVFVEEELVLGATGKVIGNVKAKGILAGGSVQGNMEAMEKIEIASTGKVTGDIKAKKLIIDENAVFQGRCVMNTGSEKEPASGKQPVSEIQK